VGDPLDIVLRLGERGGVEDVAPEDLPRVTSCGTDECVDQGLRAIGWERRHDPSWSRPPDRPGIRRGLGFALCMQGSGIAYVDMGSCSIKINDDGSFNLLVGATDLGTGADTVQAQIAAEVLGVPVEDIMVYSADTDLTPFDVGAYASGTTLHLRHGGQESRRGGPRQDPSPSGANAGSRRVGFRRVARQSGLSTRWSFAVAVGGRPRGLPHEVPGADHGNGVASCSRVALAICRLVR
jgi:hypothetical protein